MTRVFTLSLVKNLSLSIVVILGFLVMGGCVEHPKKVFLQIPDTTVNNPIVGLYSRLFLYWGKIVSEVELTKALKQFPKLSALENLCEENELLCLPSIVNLQIVKKLVNNKVPILVYGVYEYTAIGWGTICEEQNICIISGYDEEQNLLYLIPPGRKEAEGYPQDTLTLGLWAGKKEGEILLIIPKKEEKRVKRLLPAEALERGRELLHLREEESAFAQKTKGYVSLSEQVESFIEERRGLAKRHPDWAYAYYLAGYPLLMLQGNKEGLKMSKKACELEASPYYHLALASAYLKIADYKKAREEIKRYYRTAGNKVILSCAFLETYIDVKEAKFAEAEHRLKRMIEELADENPLKRELRMLYVLLKFEEGEPEKALTEFREIAKCYNYFPYKLPLFRLYLRLGRYEEAKKLYSEVKKELGRDTIKKQSLQTWEKELKFATAETLGQKLSIAKELRVYGIIMNMDLIAAYLERGKWREAEKLLASDRNLDVNYLLFAPPRFGALGPPPTRIGAAEILSAQGIIAYHKGDKEKAKELFKEAIRYAEEPLSLFTPFAANAILTPKAYLGIIYYEEGQEDRARMYLKEAFSKNVPFLGDKEAKEVAKKLGLL